MSPKETDKTPAVNFRAVLSDQAESEVLTRFSCFLNEERGFLRCRVVFQEFHLDRLIEPSLQLWEQQPYDGYFSNGKTKAQPYQDQVHNVSDHSL